MTARVYDTNGWFEVPNNPISKVGIYPYSGAQIGAPAHEADKIFRVYRPAEELSHPDAMASFMLVPFVDDHTMLGNGFTDTDDKGIPGVMGEKIYFKDDTLYGNPKIFSSGLAEKIKNGKTEISMGYRCKYDFTPGTWNGQQYDVVQRGLRGNHVALVDEGRMGPEVSILDHMTITVDAKETFVDPELKAALEAIMARLAALEGKADEVEPTDEEKAAKLAADEEAAKTAADAEAEAAKTAADEEAAAAAAKDSEEEKPASMDAALKIIAKQNGRIAALEKRPAMDEAAIVTTLARKSTLAEQISEHIGTFDHLSMTLGQVAKYGIEKLEIKNVTPGHELVALDAFLQARPKPTGKTVAMDQQAAPSALATSIDAYSKGA